MVKTLQVSDETYNLLAIVKKVTKMKSDTVLRYSLESMFPGILDPGFLKSPRQVQVSCLMQNFAEFLAAHVEPAGEWDGWTEKKASR